MKGKIKEESSYKIKVNKTLIHKKNICNLKNINTPKKLNNTMKKKNILFKRNSFCKDVKLISNLDFNSFEKSTSNDYSQNTYTCKYLIEDNSNKKGNIFYDMQNNKYLKPILDSKDIQKKILKCGFSEPLSNRYNFNKDNNKHSHIKCLSELSSPKIKKSTSLSKEKYNVNNNNNISTNVIKIKNEKINNKNIYYLLNNLKIYNSKSNYPIKFLRNSLNNKKENYSCFNKIGVNSNNDNINSLTYNDKQSKTCKNFYKKKISYDSYENNSKNSFKFHNNLNKNNINSFTNDKSFNKLLYEKLRYFCNFLEIFFLNIIKNMFRRFINNISLIENQNIENNIYKINSDTNTRRNTLYDSESVRSHKNSIFGNDMTIKPNTYSNVNFFALYEINKKLNNLTNRFDRDIVGHSKDKKNIEKYTEKTKDYGIKNKIFNKIKKSESIENNKNIKRNKNKYNILKKKFTSNKTNLLIYQKKVNLPKVNDKSVKIDQNKTSNKIKDNNNSKNDYNLKSLNNTNTYFYNIFSDNDDLTINKNKTKKLILKNKIKFDYEEFKTKKLFINFKYYKIKDINYSKKYINKYKNKKHKNHFSFFRNINFSINEKNNSNLYKRIKINKKTDKKSHRNNNNNIINQSDSNLNKTKKIYNINIHSVYKKDDTNMKKNLEQYCYRNKTTRHINIKYDFNDKNEKVNKIIINCAKFLTKIIKKSFVKKYFNILKKI